MTYRILLVCMGNICRSPTAEVVLRQYIKRNRLGDKVEVDSAGTHGYHVGEPPDQRTQRAAAVRGYNLSQLRARKVAPQDIEYFDLILAMDKANLDNLRRIAPEEAKERIKLFMDYAHNFDDEEVPDPYYGGADGFERVYDICLAGCQGLLEEIQRQLAR